VASVRKSGHLDAREAVQADELDQPLDLRLGAAQQQLATAPAQAPGEQCQVDHQRCVGEGEFGEVDDDVSLSCERTR
jgi:hypothetical protein